MFCLGVAFLLLVASAFSSETLVFQVPTVFTGNSDDSIAGSASISRFDVPQDVSLTPDGTQLFVTDRYGANIRVVEMSTGFTTKIENVGGEPRYLDASGTDQRVYYTLDGKTKRLNLVDDSFDDFASWGNAGICRCFSVGGSDLVIIAQGSAIRIYDTSGTLSFQLGDVSISNEVPQQGKSGTAMRFKSIQGIAIRPDCTLLAVTDSGSNMVAVIDLSTQTILDVFGSGSRNTLDGHASVAQFYDPKGVSWSPNGEILVVTQNDDIPDNGQDFRGLRFIEMVSKQVFSSSAFLPTSASQGVQVLNGSTGTVAVTFESGVAVFSNVRQLIDVCPISGIGSHFPLAVLSSFGTEPANFGRKVLVNQCAQGFTPSYSAELTCGEGGTWTVTDDTGFSCAMTSLLELIAEMNQELSTMNDLVVEQSLLIQALQQEDANLLQTQEVAVSLLPALETDATQTAVSGPVPKTQGTLWLNNQGKPAVVFGGDPADAAFIFKTDNDLVLQANGGIVAQSDVRVSGTMHVQEIDIIEAIRNVSEAIQQLAPHATP